MLIETSEMVMRPATDAVRIMMKEPRQCACGRMAYFLINRGGKTRCVECDAKTAQG